MNYQIVYLKKEKSAVAKNRHPWIFDGALDHKRTGKVKAGLVELRDDKDRFIGVGTYNPRSTISVRVFCFENRPLDEAFFKERFTTAAALRKVMVDADTNSYRLFNGEGDGIPGLVIDGFNGHLVTQIGTPGLKDLKNVWLPVLEEVFSPVSLLARSDQGAANREHMDSITGQLLGETPEQVEITENGRRFVVDLRKGQKTGFFFDQRDNRKLTSSLAKDRSVLDAFCYHGAFSVGAIGAGAASVVAVDSSAAAIEHTKRNVSLNFESVPFEAIEADCNSYLREASEPFDLIILDPPAMAKKKQHVEKASRAYKDLFMQGILKLAPSGILLACSCSSAISRQLFDQIIFAAAKDAKREVKVLARRGAGPDHPVSIYHPQGDYLKAVLICTN